jgi:hypothetical protein
MTTDETAAIRRMAAEIDAPRQFRRVTLDLPEVWLELAALIDRKTDTRRGRSIPAAETDERALKLLINWLELEAQECLHLLVHGEHPCQRKPKPRPAGDHTADLDDQIPF